MEAPPCLKWRDKHMKLRKYFPSFWTKGIYNNNSDFKHFPNTWDTSTTRCFLQTLLAREKHVLSVPAKLMLHFELLVEQRVDTVSTWRCQLAHFTMTATTSSEETRDAFTSSLRIKLLVNSVGSSSFQERLVILPHQRCKRMEPKMSEKAILTLRWKKT